MPKTILAGPSWVRLCCVIRDAREGDRLASFCVRTLRDHPARPRGFASEMDRAERHSPSDERIFSLSQIKGIPGRQLAEIADKPMSAEGFADSRRPSPKPHRFCRKKLFIRQLFLTNFMKTPAYN